jgi:heat shock protein HslJ
MNFARLGSGLIPALFCISLHAQSPAQRVTVTGTLTRSVAIGGESTGWTIQLEPATTIDGKQMESIEVSYPKTQELQKLVNRRVQASGLLSHRPGVETGERLILVVSSLKEVKSSTQTSPPHAVPFTLSGSEWKLEELGGTGVIESVQATLSFPEAGKVTGNGSCNRFFGTAQISKDSIKFSPLGSTRMACPEELMNQETKYLGALQSAERFEWKDPYLLIYCKGFEKPLRFTRMPASSLATN